MPVELYPISYIDDINIHDTIIEQCKMSYEAYGKEKAYEKMNQLLNSKDPPQTKRNLYLYRTAMYLTKKAHILGEGYIEKEILNEGENKYNIIFSPIWKREKWSFLDKDADVLLRSQSVQAYTVQSQFRLDDYDSERYYNNAYNSSTSLNLKKRGGSAIMRIKRFDFEYKYSNSEYYTNYYKYYLYNTFRRILFLTGKRGVYNVLPIEETEALYAILGSIDNSVKISILKNIKNFILFEKDDKTEQKELSKLFKETISKLDAVFYINKDSYGDYSVNTENNVNLTQPEKEENLKNIDNIKSEYKEKDILRPFIDFLSELHDTLLLPFEFISYFICALINPRYEAIIEDSNGNMGSYIFGGNHAILPTEKSYIGPSKTNNSADGIVSTVVSHIPLLSDDDVTLYETLYIASNQEHTICCYSYNKNKWLTLIPLVNKTTIPIPDILSNTERKLINLIPVCDLNKHHIVWFIYSDRIISYDCSMHSWITDIDDDPFHIIDFNMELLFPESSQCIHACYDENKKILICIDNSGNIGSLNLEYGTFASYAETVLTMSIHFDINQDTQGIIKMKRIITLDSSNASDDTVVTVLGYNDEACQIIEYSSSSGIKKLFEFNYYTNSPIVDVVRLADTKKVYIIYANHKIIELSTYLYTPYIFQDAQDSDIAIELANKTYCNAEECPIYITTDHKIHMLHLIYNTDNRISTLNIPLEKYINDEANISKYEEHFIKESSLPLFSNSYYALVEYLNALKYPISKRS
jgi:hypothetical protein